MWGCMFCCGAAYLAYIEARNHPYSSVPWRIIRGELDTCTHIICGVGGYSFCVPYNSGTPEVVWQYQLPDPSAIIKIHIGPHCCKDTGASRKILDNLDSVSGAEYMRSIESLQRMLVEACKVYTNGFPATAIEAEGECRTGAESL